MSNLPPGVSPLDRHINPTAEVDMWVCVQCFRENELAVCDCGNGYGPDIATPDAYREVINAVRAGLPKREANQFSRAAHAALDLIAERWVWE